MISLDDALDDKKNGVFILRDVQCLVTFLFTFVCDDTHTGNHLTIKVLLILRASLLKLNNI